MLRLPGADMRCKNVFILGLNDFNRKKLTSIRGAKGYTFHGLLETKQVYDAEEFPLEELLEQAEGQLTQWRETTGERIDAIAGYMDFPVSLMLPLLCARFKTPSPSLESVLACEHKYWSRLLQQQVIPEHIPGFRLFDPFDSRAFEQIDLEPPFWIKPVKSYGSFLGFIVTGRTDFELAREHICRHIGLIAEPFRRILDRASLPPEIAGIDGFHCLAESMLTGSQCTMEGYVCDGRIESLGFIDSIRYDNGSSFFRYEYPSSLPSPVLDRMARIARQALGSSGLNSSAFNVEFYWQAESDRIWLLEINPRISQSHCDLFEKVDGSSNQQITVQLACGETPQFPGRKGSFACAANFFWRVFEGDALVRSVPSAAEVATLQARLPGTLIMPKVSPGMKLSDLRRQDSYSFTLCNLYIGGRDRADLLNRYQQCQDGLTFQLEPIRTAGQ